MTAISFRIPKYSNSQDVDHDDLGSYILGFASTGTNFKIRVNSFQDITNLILPKSYKRVRSANNVKFTNVQSGLVTNDNIDSALNIKRIPNWAATLNIRFGSPTGVTNYDIVSALVTASGLPEAYLAGYGEESTKPNSVRIYAAEICHKNPSTGVLGSGSTNWSSFVYLSNSYLSLSKNPGPSGINAAVGGTGMVSNIHDWYLAISISPLDINSVPLMPLTCIIEYL
jgi:hypothetical protein